MLGTYFLIADLRLAEVTIPDKSGLAPPCLVRPILFKASSCLSGTDPEVFRIGGPSVGRPVTRLSGLGDSTFSAGAGLALVRESTSPCS